MLKAFFVFLEAVPDGVVVVDERRRITFVNRSASALFGCKTTDLSGRPLDALFPEASRSWLHRRMDESCGNGPTSAATIADRDSGGRRSERRIDKVDVASIDSFAEQDAFLMTPALRPDGGEITVEIGISRAPFSSLGAAGVFLRKATARARAETVRSLLVDLVEDETLHRLGRYDDAVSAVARLCAGCLPDYCLIETSRQDGEQGVWVAASSEANRYLGIALQEDWRRGWPLASAARAARTPVLVRDNQIDEVSKRSRGRAASALESIRPRSLIRVPFPRESSTKGSMVFLSSGARRYSEADLAFGIEATHCVARYLDTARLVIDARRAVEMRDEMMEVVTHDLLNSLNAVKLTTGALRHSYGRPGDNAERRFTVLERAVAGMARLIGDLRDIREMELGHFAVFPKAEREPARLVEIAVEMATAGAGSRTIEIEPPPVVLPPIVVDEERILQVLSNLIGNAIKFTLAPSAIVAGVLPAAGVVRFFVRDGGPGIPAGDEARVFERRWRGRASDQPGSGLGLAICKAIVEGHGGHIGVTNNAAGGCTFQFTIPISLAEKRPPADTSPSPLPTKRQSALALHS